MRPCRAGLMASAQTSMSLACARASPQITEFLARRAISWTLSKSPWLAMGKPASMMSTPISSSSSATSSFSSKVMVAPGHCSPSRKVVSKMTTRPADFVGFLVGVMCLVLNSWPGSLARLASRLNYRGFLLPSPERRPRLIGESEGAQGRLRRSSARLMCAREVAAGKPVPAPNPISPRVACIDHLSLRGFYAPAEHSAKPSPGQGRA